MSRKIAKMEDDMRVTITLDLNEEAQRQLIDNSIERVLNNAERCGHELEQRGGSFCEEGSSLWQDANELRQLATMIWNVVRNEVFKEMQL